jgi:hypothetical protein
MMADMTRNCPGCAQPFKLPEELFGQSIRCPSCQVVFTPTRDEAASDAPLRSSGQIQSSAPELGTHISGSLREADCFDHPPSREHRRYDYRDDYHRPFRRDQTVASMINAPAIIMMVWGGIGVFGGLLALVFLIVMCFVEPPTPSEQFIPIVMISSVLIMALYCTIIVLGAYKMMTRQSYSFAMTASIMTLMCPNILTIGLGIWALVILCKQDVRREFQSIAKP